MPEEFNWEGEEEVQSWMIGYYEGRQWHTILLPGDEVLKRELVEELMLSLNDHYPLVYARKKMGMLEKKRHTFKRKEFVGFL